MPIFARFTRFCDLGAFAQNERSRLLWFREGNNLIFPQIPSNFTCQSIRQAKVLACFRVNFFSGCVRYTSETSDLKIFYIHAFLNVPQWERSGLFKRRFSNLDFCLFSLRVEKIRKYFIYTYHCHTHPISLSTLWTPA